MIIVDNGKYKYIFIHHNNGAGHLLVYMPQTRLTLIMQYKINILNRT